MGFLHFRSSCVTVYVCVASGCIGLDTVHSVRLRQQGFLLSQMTPKSKAPETPKIHMWYYVIAHTVQLVRANSWNVLYIQYVCIHTKMGPRDTRATHDTRYTIPVSLTASPPHLPAGQETRGSTVQSTVLSLQQKSTVLSLSWLSLCTVQYLCAYVHTVLVHSHWLSNASSYCSYNTKNNCIIQWFTLCCSHQKKGQ